MSKANNLKPTAAGKKREEMQKAASIVRQANKVAAIAARALAQQASQPAPLTKEQIEDIVSKTVLATLANLGIRADNGDDVDEIREDFRYIRSWRKTVQKTTRTGWLTFITVLASGFLSVLYLGLRTFFGGH